ncbi:hypothetical protein GNP93_25860 [Paenibacillus validus]|uniref:Glycoside hydrolase family 13 N-terminal Ig-like domain-containing protein n=1 Tax=Paenibacillus validus TaxID=44253 RepID=A0A7X3CUZ6_9BACL|nr:hypothetical protein [Paenibacillus validus]
MLRECLYHATRNNLGLCVMTRTIRLRTKRGDVEEAVLIAGDKSSGI